MQNMPKVQIYTTAVCPYCIAAKRLLALKGVTQAQMEEVSVDREPARRDEMVQRTGRRTVPQIFVGDTHVGGYDDLQALDQAGKLVPLLEVTKQGDKP